MAKRRNNFRIFYRYRNSKNRYGGHFAMDCWTYPAYYGNRRK